MKFQEQIEKYINDHKEEMIDDICELCGINSVKMEPEEDMPYGPGAAECLDTALDMAEGYGFEVLDYDGYVGCVDLNEKPAQLDILAHLDVVPAGEGWTVTEPFRPLVKDGKIYGRGTSDDKGPAIAALYAMRAIKDLKIPMKKNVRLILGTDEECGSSDIEHYYAVEKEAPMTFSPDAEYPLINIEKGRLPGHFTAEFQASASLPRLAGMKVGTATNVVPGKAKALIEGVDPETLNKTAEAVTEKTGVKFTFEEQGSCQEITAWGKGAHGSLPDDGVNALTGLLTLITELPMAECPQMTIVKNLITMMPHRDGHGTALGVDMEDELSGRLSLAFSMLEVTAEHVDGMFDSRVPICGNEKNVLAVLKEKFLQNGLKLHNDSMVEPHHVSGDSEFVQTLLKCYEHYTGLKGECLAIGGGTYVHHLKNGVAFGCCMPGVDPHMHGADEYVIIEDMLTSAKIFAQAIVELCG